MKIKDLPQEIKEVALQRQVEQGNTPNEDLELSSSKKQGNFNWDETPEYGIWCDVSDNNFIAFYEMHPKTTQPDKTKLKDLVLKIEALDVQIKDMNKSNVIFKQTAKLLKKERRKQINKLLNLIKG